VRSEKKMECEREKRKVRGEREIKRECEGERKIKYATI